jgi:hypothetical protein
MAACFVVVSAVSELVARLPRGTVIEQHLSEDTCALADQGPHHRGDA